MRERSLLSLYSPHYRVYKFYEKSFVSYGDTQCTAKIAVQAGTGWLIPRVQKLVINELSRMINFSLLFPRNASFFRERQIYRNTVFSRASQAPTIPSTSMTLGRWIDLNHESCTSDISFPYLLQTHRSVLSYLIRSFLFSLVILAKRPS